MDTGEGDGESEESLIRVAVVTPVLAVRAGLRLLLESGASEACDIEVVDEAARLIDLDLSLGEVDVLLLTAEAASHAELAAALQTSPSPPAVLLLASSPEEGRILPGLPVRAWGLLEIEASQAELLAAVQAVHEGLLAGSPVLLEPFLGRSQPLGGGAVDPLVEPLTERETQVLQLLAEGLANKQIAVVLGISEHTVKFHVSAIYSKLGVSNRTEAVRLGVQRGLILL